MSEVNDGDIDTKRWLESGEAKVRSERGNYIRQYLADAQSGCCAICGGPSLWLDLRLTCPNSDSQLATYKSRNRGKGRHYRRQRYADGRSY